MPTSKRRAEKTFQFRKGLRKQIKEEIGRKVSGKELGRWLVLDHPPRGIEGYKKLLQDARHERKALEADLAKAKGKTAKQRIKDKMDLLDKVILAAERKVEEYERAEMERKVRSRAETDVKDVIYEEEKRERMAKIGKKEVVKNLFEVHKALKKKRKE